MLFDLVQEEEEEGKGKEEVVFIVVTCLSDASPDHSLISLSSLLERRRDINGFHLVHPSQPGTFFFISFLFSASPRHRQGGITQTSSASPPPPSSSSSSSNNEISLMSLKVLKALGYLH